MALVCPVCETHLQGQYIAKCGTCDHTVYKEECVACGVTYYSYGTGMPMHNHQCDPRKLVNRDRDSEGYTGRTPTVHERLADGFRAMSDDSE